MRSETSPQISHVCLRTVQADDANDSGTIRMIETEARDPQTYAVIGAAMDIHRLLGHAFLEAIYQEAALTSSDEAQVPNYLKATGFQRAVPIDFGVPKLEYKRLVLMYMG